MNKSEKEHYKIRTKTILIWFLYSLKIDSSYMDGKYPRFTVHYHFKPRIIPCIIFYLIILIPIFIFGGIMDCIEIWIDTFKKRTQRDIWQQVVTIPEITRTFAYNRF